MDVGGSNKRRKTSTRLEIGLCSIFLSEKLRNPQAQSSDIITELKGRAIKLLGNIHVDDDTLDIKSSLESANASSIRDRLIDILRPIEINNLPTYSIQKFVNQLIYVKREKLNEITSASVSSVILCLRQSNFPMQIKNQKFQEIATFLKPENIQSLELNNIQKNRAIVLLKQIVDTQIPINSQSIDSLLEPLSKMQIGEMLDVIDFTLPAKPEPQTKNEGLENLFYQLANSWNQPTSNRSEIKEAAIDLCERIKLKIRNEFSNTRSRICFDEKEELLSEFDEKKRLFESGKANFEEKDIREIHKKKIYLIHMEILYLSESKKYHSMYTMF